VSDKDEQLQQEVSNVNNVNNVAVVVTAERVGGSHLSSRLYPAHLPTGYNPWV